jgi:hypothetical protein
MSSAVAILTFNRCLALQVTLKGLLKHVKDDVPVAIFDDCTIQDETHTWLKKERSKETPDDELMAYELAKNDPKDPQIFLGARNLGVAGNSNRAIRWFMTRTKADHLILMNDDLHVLGDFVTAYGKAHADLDLGLFCFNDFVESESHRWVIQRHRGYPLKLFPRMTGIMMSMTRKLVESVGYYDMKFGKFGEEHCGFNNRARFMGFLRIAGRDQPCIDVQFTPPLLAHQDVESCVSGPARQAADQDAVRAMHEESRFV